MVKEEWLDVEGFESYYQVSNLGRLLSKQKGTVKKLDTNSAGYLRGMLCSPEKRQRVFMHRLVAHHFVGGYFEGAVVNHKDYNRMNNMAENLEWVTRSENSKHMCKRGLHNGMFKKKPYKLRFSDGAEVFYESMDAVAKSVGMSTSKLYYVLADGGYLRELECTILPCVSNDHP